MLSLGNKRLSLLIGLCLILLVSNQVSAEEITFKEAVEIGFKNNQSILDKKDVLEQIERELTQIKAGADWQLNLTTDVSNNDLQKQIDLSLVGSKSYFSGLTLQPKLYLQEDNISANSLDSDDLGLKVSLSQDLYPQVPIQAEQNYIKQKLDLQAAQARYEAEKNDKLVSWIEDYLNLIRCKEEYELAIKEHKLAESNLTEVQTKQEIGEVGKNDILAAQIEVKAAQRRLKQAKSSYQQAKKKLSQELGLVDNQELVVTTNSSYLKKLKKKVSLLPKLDNKDKLLELAVNNSVQILTNQLKQKSIKHELKWSQAEEKPNLKVSANYDPLQEKWEAGVNLAYNLVDSGKQESKREGIEAQLTSSKRQYDNLVSSLEIELDNLVEQIKTNRVNLEEKELSLDKAQLEQETAKEKLKQGLIDDFDLAQKKIEYKKSKLAFKRAQDKLLISQLKLIEFLGREVE